MAKKRKTKKQEKKQASKFSASSQSSSSVGEALQKAGIEEKKKSMPTKPAKDDPKPINRKKISVDDIAGFGDKTPKKGKAVKKKLAVHTVLTDSTALCDSRITSVTIHKSMDHTAVTCKKCQSHRMHKEYVEILEGKAPKKTEDKPEPDKEVKDRGPKKADKPKQDKGKSKPAPEKTKETEPEEIVEEEIVEEVVDFDQLIDDLEENLKNIMNVRLRKLEARLFEKLKAECQVLLEARPRFFLVRKANNLFQIVHDPSRYVILDNVKEEVASNALPQYLAIQFHWDGSSKPPSEWITEVRKISEEFAKTKKPKRQLKRRAPSIKKRKDRPEPKRKIRRRQK